MIDDMNMIRIQPDKKTYSVTGEERIRAEHNLRIRSAQNNMVYDPTHFIDRVQSDIFRKRTDPDFFSEWIAVLIDTIRTNRTSLQIQMEMEHRRKTYHPESICLVDYAYRAGVIIADHFNDLENRDPDNRGDHQGQRRIHLHPAVQENLDRIHIRIRENTCVVCRLPTNEFIENACENNCGYYCHDLCAARWIVARFDHPRPYCMICGADHAVNQIPLVTSDQAFILAARERVAGGFLDLNNLGPQFLNYLDFRGIGLNQLNPLEVELVVELEAND